MPDEQLKPNPTQAPVWADVLADWPEISPPQPMPPTLAWYYAQLPGGQAIALWGELRLQLASLGWWPLLLGRQSEALTRPVSGRSWPVTAAYDDLLSAAESLDLEAWIDSRLARHTQQPRPEELSDFAAFFSPELIAPNQQFSVHLSSLTGEPYASVGLALIPAKAGWQAPAFLSIGGWRDCPTPEVHMRLLRDWQSRYGAELVGFSGEMLELRVLRPPDNDDAALILARQQQAYCPALIEQGVQTRENLARLLQDSSVWYFWWT